VVTGVDYALSGTSNQRPNLSGNWRLPDGRDTSAQIAQWFNPAAFTAPAQGTFGNAGRDLVIGPGSTTANIALFKNLPLPFGSGVKAQFRAEFFNVLNSVNLSNPNGTLGANLGRITSAGSARVGQFALKVLF
jgi:hypothetical protein